MNDFLVLFLCYTISDISGIRFSSWLSNYLFWVNNLLNIFYLLSVRFDKLFTKDFLSDFRISSLFFIVFLLFFRSLWFISDSFIGLGDFSFSY